MKDRCEWNKQIGFAASLIDTDCGCVTFPHSAFDLYRHGGLKGDAYELSDKLFKDHDFISNEGLRGDIAPASR